MDIHHHLHLCRDLDLCTDLGHRHHLLHLYHIRIHIRIHLHHYHLIIICIIITFSIHHLNMWDHHVVDWISICSSNKHMATVMATHIISRSPLRDLGYN